MVKRSDKKKHGTEPSSNVYLVLIGATILMLIAMPLILLRPIETIAQNNCMPIGEERLSLLKNSKEEIDRIRQTVADQQYQLDKAKAEHPGFEMDALCSSKTYKLYVF